MVRLLTRQTLFSALLLLPLMAAGGAMAADDMPPPKRAPRIKVQEQKLAVEEARGNRMVTGMAKVVDAEKIKVGDTELRLFGIILPKSGTPFAAEARAGLEKILNNESVTCRVQDRDKGFRLLGACRTAQHNDLSLALLQQGWAVVARGTVQQTDYADPYLAAEAKAQLQQLGMWAPAPDSKAETKVAEAAETPAKDTKDTKDTKETKDPAPKDSADSKPSVSVTPPPALAATPAQPQVPAMQPAEAATIAAAPVINVTAVSSAPGWLWLVGIVPAALMILFAAGQIALRRYEYQQERKAVAAALRGELMAARAICASRADTLGYGADATSKLSSIWPRLRSTVYQAYVGRLGLLGPDLTRRISSLYGQFADYAQFYAPRPNSDAAGKIDNAAVQQTLFTIIDHIEDTLTNLQAVEATGRAPSRLLPQRTGLGGARPQRLSERPKTEQLEYVEAELVEDEAAIKSVSPPKPETAKPDATKTEDKPVTATAESAARAGLHTLAGETPKTPEAPKSAESADKTAEPVITAAIKQDKQDQAQAKTGMTESTLATLTVTHDALKTEPAAQTPPASALTTASKATAEIPAAPAPSGIAPSNAAATGSENAATDIGGKKTETEATTGNQTEPAGAGKTRAARRKPKADVKTEDDESEDDPATAEYYDFRNHAVRIAKS